MLFFKHIYTVIALQVTLFYFNLRIYTMKVYKCIVTCAMMLFSIAFYGNTNDDLTKLMSSDSEEKTEALRRLIEAQDLAAFPVLSAINDKKLFVYGGKLVTLGKKTTHNNITVYELITLYPETKGITDQKNKSLTLDNVDLKEITFSRKDRLSIIPLLPFINLTSIDDEVRKLAYTQFQNKGDYSTLKRIEKAALRETDEGLIRFAKETILSIRLQNATTENVQMDLIQKLVKNKGDNNLNILTTFIDRPELDAVFKKKVKIQISSIENRSNRIEWVQNLFSGVSLGSILILIALGLSIIYGLAGVINMAHGEFMMIGAYTSFCVQELFKMTSATGELSDFFFWASIPLAFLVSGLFGLLVERLILRKLYGKPLESLLATWGISLVLIQLARTIFGDLTSVKAPSVLSGGWEVVPQLVLPYNRIFIILMTTAMIVLTFLFLYRSKNGLRIRSVTQNRAMSACLGISTKKIDAMTFFIGSGIAGIAGCCMTLIGNVVPDMGQTYIVDSFLVVVTGGVGSLFGTIAAGLGIGQLTKLLEPVFQAVYGKVIILGFIIFFLQFKPKGLFPAKGRVADD